MALTAPVGKKFEPVPKGNHVARLYKIIHIGTIEDTWQGETKLVDKVQLTFELCNEKKTFKDGDEPRPLAISTPILTLSMNEKATLRKLVEGIIGTALTDKEAEIFDIEQLLGEACLLNVIHKDSPKGIRANIQGASPLPKGMTAPDMVNEARSIDVNTASQIEIRDLPNFIREKMETSKEYQQRFGEGAQAEGGVTKDDIPF